MEGETERGIICHDPMHSQKGHDLFCIPGPGRQLRYPSPEEK